MRNNIFKILILISQTILIISCSVNNYTFKKIAISTETLKSPKSIMPTITNVDITLTPFVISSAKEAEDQIRNLIKYNAGCSLPCWWGITPGISTSSEFQTILESLVGTSNSEYLFAAGDGFFSMSPKVNGFHLGIQYSAKNNLISVIYINTEMIKNSYEKDFSNESYFDVMSSYILSSILAKYGKPEQVLIRSFSGVARENNPTQTLLFYPANGVIVQYFSPNGLLIEKNNFVIPTCPPKGHISLRLFDPNTNLSLEELLKLNDSYIEYKDISEATNMDINMFYDNFQYYDTKSLETICPAAIKTPENLWPGFYSNP